MRTHNPATGIVTCKCDASSIAVHESFGPANLCHLCGVKKPIALAAARGYKVEDAK